MSVRCQLTEDEINAALTGCWAEQCPPIASPAQLAQLFGLSVSTIYEWLAKGRLDGAYRKRGKHALIWRDRAIKNIFNSPEWRTEQ